MFASHWPWAEKLSCRRDDLGPPAKRTCTACWRGISRVNVVWSVVHVASVTLEVTRHVERELVTVKQQDRARIGNRCRLARTQGSPTPDHG